MTHETISDYLSAHTDANYNAFNARIVTTSLPTIRVRVPDLRILARQIEKSGWANEFSATQSPQTHEEWVLHGLVIAERKVSLSKMMPLIEAFVPKIENWAVCDTFCGSLKRVDKEREKTLNALGFGRYSPCVLRRAVRKSCESFRVAPQDKTYLKTLLK